MTLILPALIFVAATMRAVSLIFGARHWTRWPNVEDGLTIGVAFGAILAMPFVVM